MTLKAFWTWAVTGWCRCKSQILHRLDDNVHSSGPTKGREQNGGVLLRSLVISQALPPQAACIHFYRPSRNRCFFSMSTLVRTQLP